MKLQASAGIGLLTALVLAGGALAAPAAPAPAPAGPVTGPVIPGICVFSRERAVFGSAAGDSLQRRMKDLEAAVVAELQPEATGLQSEEATLSAQANQIRAANAQPDQAFLQRAEAFQQRANAFQEKRNLRNRELQETIAKQAKRINDQIDPVLPLVSAERGCGLIIDGNSVIVNNPGMDMTTAVVTRLNTRIGALTFERERLNPAAAAGAQAGPPVAAAPRKPAVKK